MRKKPIKTPPLTDPRTGDFLFGMTRAKGDLLGMIKSLQNRTPFDPKDPVSVTYNAHVTATLNFIMSLTA